MSFTKFRVRGTRDTRQRAPWSTWQTPTQPTRALEFVDWRIVGRFIGGSSGEWGISRFGGSLECECFECRGSAVTDIESYSAGAMASRCFTSRTRRGGDCDCWSWWPANDALPIATKPLRHRVDHGGGQWGSVDSGGTFTEVTGNSKCLSRPSEHNFQVKTCSRVDAFRATGPMCQSFSYRKFSLSQVFYGNHGWSPSDRWISISKPKKFSISIYM